MKRPCPSSAFQLQRTLFLSFLVLLRELSQVIPELDIPWLRDQLKKPSTHVRSRLFYTSSEVVDGMDALMHEAGTLSS